MSEVARLYRYKSLLVNPRAVLASEIISELEISPATFKRYLAKFRGQLHMPITFDCDLGGYRLEQGHTFSPQRSRWVSRETWHPNQRDHTEPNGSYVLEIPYSDERELLGDILRFGSEVEVLEPQDLRSRIKRALHEAAGRYV